MSEMIVKLNSDKVKLKGCEYVQDLVRCGECKLLNANGECKAFADSMIRPNTRDFCSRGEREETKE